MARVAAGLLLCALGVTSVLACQGEDADVAHDDKEKEGGGDGLDGGSNDGRTDPNVVEGNPKDVEAGNSEAGNTEAGSTDAGPGFQMTTPEIPVAAGAQAQTCYYFRASNTVDLAVKSFASKQGAAVSFVALVFTDTERQAAGTLSPDNCAMFDGSGPSTWVYSSWSAQNTWSLPADDGTGKPLGKPMKANQPAFLVIHTLNATAAPVTAKVELSATAHAPGTAVTAAEPFVTYAQSIDIPANTSGNLVSKACDVPAGAKFTWLTAHSWTRATSTAIKDPVSDATIFSTTGSNDHSVKAWSAAPFYAFPNNRVRYECVFANNTGASIQDGPNPKSDENCMMLSYHFPATKPRFCVDNILVP